LLAPSHSLNYNLSTQPDGAGFEAATASGAAKGEKDVQQVTEAWQKKLKMLNERWRTEVRKP
jgi:hypothetical protein